MDLDAAIDQAKPSISGPSPEVVSQHRSRLTQAMQTTGSASVEAAVGASVELLVTDADVLPVQPLPTSRPQGRRVLVGAIAAATLLFGVVTVYAISGRSGSVIGDVATDPSASPPSSDESARAEEPSTPSANAASDVDVVELVCGADLPFITDLPDGAKLVTGPLPGSPPASDGQLVRHWIGSTGSGEIRWPSDPRPLYGDPVDDGPPSALAISAPIEDGVTIDLHVVFPDSGSGDETNELVIDDSVEPAVAFTTHGSTWPPGDGCESMQLRLLNEVGDETTMLTPVYVDPELLESPDGHPAVVSAYLQSAQALITSQVETASLPPSPAPVSPCIVPDNADAIEPIEAEVEATAYWKTPAEALQGFLEVSEFATRLPHSGYAELTSPEGLVYVYPAPNGSGLYNALVTVDETPAGWKVTSIAKSGC